MSLSPDQQRRYARHILLPEVGGVGQRRLFAATVRVRELDRAAAAALVYLAAAGVGTLVIDDARPVSEGDGLLFEAADVGRPRDQAARERVRALNPDVTVRGAGDGDAGAPVAATVCELVIASRDDDGGATNDDDAVTALERGALAAETLIRELAAC